MNEFIDIKKTITALVKALDTLNPILKNHHRRVAIIAYGIGRAMALTQEQMSNLVIASAMHDIGAISISDSEELAVLDVFDPQPHEALGALMISGFPLFEKVSKILKHHHVNYEEAGRHHQSEVPIESYLLHLADRIDIVLKSYKIAINQKEDVTIILEQLSGGLFDPLVFKGFIEASKHEQFWFDIDLLTVESLFDRITYDHLIDHNDHLMIEGLAATLSHIIDYRSMYSVANSDKVAHAAGALAGAMGLSEDLCFDLKIAGYLHDLGMLAIPIEILNKTSELTKNERNIIKLHPYHTKRILSDLKGFDEISEWCTDHHSIKDKTKAPYNVELEILMVADIFAAMSSNRAYRHRYTYESIIASIVSNYETIISEGLLTCLKTIGPDLYKELIQLEDEMLKDYRTHIIPPREGKVDGYHYLKTELYRMVQFDVEILGFIQDASLDGMWYWDLNEPENEWMNGKFWRTLGYEPTDKKHLSKEWKEIVFKEDLVIATDNLKQHCEDPSYPYDQVMRFWHKDGHIVWVRCRGMAIRDKKGKAIRMLGAHTEITEQMNLQIALQDRNELLESQKEQIEALNKELKRLSSMDYLTGLYNRQTIDNFLDEEVKRVKRDRQTFTVMMIDINAFKGINDTYGHLVGDRVLIDLAQRMKADLRDQDIKARWGGDEFMVIFPETPYKYAKGLLERFMSTMNRWYIVHKDHAIHYDVSVGMSAYIPDETITKCVERADKALYKDKLGR